MMTFNEAKQLAWWSESEIAEFFSVSIQTVRRWSRTGEAPVPVIKCLEVLAGYFPAHSKRLGWYGWRFNGGYLWSPSGDAFLPADLMAFTRYWQYVSALEAKIRELEALQRQDGLAISGSNILQFPVRKRQMLDSEIA